MLEISMRKKPPLISFIRQREFTIRLIEIKENQLICNSICIIINNGHLIPSIPVLFLIKKRKNKKLNVLTKEPYTNVHTIKMVYSAILNLLFDMMFHNKLILTYFEGSKYPFLPPLSSMTHLFSTLTYQNITEFKQFSKKLQLVNLLNRLFSMMTHTDGVCTSSHHRKQSVQELVQLKPFENYLIVVIFW